MGCCVGMDVSSREGACDGCDVGLLDGFDVSRLLGGLDGIAVIEGTRVGIGVFKVTETSEIDCAETPENSDTAEKGAASARAALTPIVLISDIA